MIPESKLVTALKAIVTSALVILSGLVVIILAGLLAWAVVAVWSHV